jgi:hypothetical protein
VRAANNLRRQADASQPVEIESDHVNSEMRWHGRRRTGGERARQSAAHGGVRGQSARAPVRKRG